MILMLVYKKAVLADNISFISSIPIIKSLTCQAIVAYITNLLTYLSIVGIAVGKIFGAHLSGGRFKRELMEFFIQT